MYFKPDRGSIQGGAAPIRLGGDFPVDPYPSGSVDEDFSRMWPASLSHCLGRFEEAENKFVNVRSGGVGAFTADNFPVFDRMAPNVFVAADSNHGYKMLAVGREIAEVLTGGHSSLLDAVLVGTLEDIEFAEMRIRWAPLLEQQLSELLEQAALPGEYGKLAEETASQLVDLYRSGGEPEWWMHDFRGQLRLQLGELLSGQEKVLGAIKMISSPDLDLESQEKALKKFQEESSLIPGLPTLPVDRSRCRNALVALYYRQHRLEEAAEVLQQEIEDPEVRSSQKDLALTKLEILKETPEPIGWEEETIPPDLREVRPEFFQGLITEGAGDGAGRIGAAYLAAELARRTKTNGRRRMTDMMPAR